MAAGAVIGAASGPTWPRTLAQGRAIFDDRDPHRFGWSIARARLVIEVSVLGVGWLLGGTVGIGTVAFAFGIGPIVQVALGYFDRDKRVIRRRLSLDEEPVPVEGAA
jgi:hypothetical protein